ncbi:hypothetical protein LTS16_003891 [Friedmanniomyces endolithicus]|nr:hypothetical protein LTS16_003891 [Friedmanniomyces endolithicus]
MSFLRATRQHLSLRSITRTTPRATFTTSTPRTASDYGSGEDAPPGQKPSEQTGKNPSEHLEHPGPAPPSVVGGSQQSGEQKDTGKSQPQQSSGDNSSKVRKPPNQRSFNHRHPRRSRRKCGSTTRKSTGGLRKRVQKSRNEDVEQDRVGI